MMSQEKQKSLMQIKQEFQDINSNPIANIGVSIGLVNNDMFEWQATMIGPSDTPYKNGLFLLRIKFPDNYPRKAPDVRFITPIYHVNVNPRAPKNNDMQSLGHVCISTLNHWKEDCKMREVFTDIFALFYVGNPNSAYGLDRAQEMKTNKELYEKKIKFFTKKYANPAKAHKLVETDWDFSYS